MVSAKRAPTTAVFTAPPTPPFSAHIAHLANRLLPAAPPRRRASTRTLAAVPPPDASARSKKAPPLRHRPVRGDGRCLFRAIAQNLAHSDNRTLAEPLERADADALRTLAWSEICQRRRAEFEKRHIIEGSVTRYCAVSNTPTYYAGEPELFALAYVLRRPIQVYLKTERGLKSIVCYGEQFAKQGRVYEKGDGVVRLLYVNGNHYDALLSR